jgi:molecular chaperone HtpG
MTGKAERTSVEFLAPDIEQIRHQLTGVLESYSNDWDIIAELLQNAIDAIVLRNPVKGEVLIEIDSVSKSITVSDNGIGIAPDDLPKLLRPFSTNKLGLNNQIGQKGVGLTFVLFSSTIFRVTTTHEDGSAQAEISGAYSWLKADTKETLPVEIKNVPPQTATGTKVFLRLSNEEHPLWSLDAKQVLFLIRTRTACGDTKHIWGTSLNCDFRLKYTDASGNVTEEEHDCKYLLPTEGLGEHETISIDQYNEWLSDKDRTDAEKRVKLKNKILFSKGTHYQAGRDLKYWSCFVPKRDVWTTLSKKFGLLQDDAADDDILISDELFDRLEFTSGLHTSSKGMPTGISIELRPRGSAGYVPNFFILIEDPSLSFDIGRKSIQGRQQAMLRELAFKKFREFLAIASKYIGGSAGDDNDYDRDELLEEIRKLPDLNSDQTLFIKRPNQQEATVAAMFYEQMGKGVFAKFRPLISGYRGRYDLYGKVENKYFAVEFKTTLAGLFRDFSDEKKMFDEIDTVVIWDVDEKDHKIIAARGLDLEEIKASEIAETSTKFPVAHFLLRLPGVNPIEVLSMKRLLGA